MVQEIKQTYDDEFLRKFHEVSFPYDKTVENAYSTYETSFQMGNLPSEQIRKTYAEAVHGDYLPDKISRLRDLSLKEIIDYFEKRPKDQAYLRLDDYELFGNCISINMPLEEIIVLDNIPYWKRVVNALMIDRCDHIAATQNRLFDWKNAGVECKLVERIETTKPENFNEEEFEKLATMAAPYVKHLNIQQMQPLQTKSLRGNQYYMKYIIINYPDELSYHISLQFIGKLEHLTELCVSFGVKELKRSYEKRLFQFSIQDVDNLSQGISQLTKLKSFTFANNDTSRVQLSRILYSLQNQPLEYLELSNCNLSEDCGEEFETFIEKISHLNTLELKDNNFAEIALLQIGQSLKKYTGTMNYLGLARNPIGEDGVLALGAGFYDTNQIRLLDFSGCIVGKMGAIKILQIIGFHTLLTWINISSIKLDFECGERLIRTLKENHNILYLNCKCCGLTVSQECQVFQLIERNNYYQRYPYVDKECFTEEHAEEIDKILKESRHPLLVEATANAKCEVYNRPINPNWISSIPSSINSRNDGLVKTNSTLLNAHYMSLFGTDSDTMIYDPLKIDQEPVKPLFTYNSNGYNPEMFAHAGIIGTSADLSSCYYFK